MKQDFKYKRVVVAEKPSVAREIAAVLGAREKEDGFISGNGYAVTWAFGHLVGLALPEEYGIAGFRRENLPILPSEFKLVPRQVKSGKEYKADPGALKQIKIIKELFAQSERIIVACDAAREGELIFRYLYSYVGSDKEFDRLWISSLTEKAIWEGFQNLKPGSDYDNLYMAAKARSEADWRIGLNSSQALTLSAGCGVYSLGRVQTPTLAMICNRYLEHRNFVSQAYVQMELRLSKDGCSFTAVSSERYSSVAEASPEAERIYQSGISTVKEVLDKDVTEVSPLLYDLTYLQKDANKRYGYSAQETLDIAQGLYEKRHITYPRTGSKHIPEDVFAEIGTLYEVLSQVNELAGFAAILHSPNINRRCVDNSKITDHHALLVTEVAPTNLSIPEQRIYQMIAIRILETFSPSCRKKSITVSLDARGHEFVAKSMRITDWGWRAVRSEQGDGEPEEINGELPVLAEGDECEMQSIELLEKQTKPKPLHTESSLLSSMENAGRDLENEEERVAMKESGIGTPATRASIIETLFTRDYIRREKKSLVPTEKGLTVFEIVKDKKIADIQMTGTWENALTKIERGEMDAETFRKGIEVYTAQITTELLNTKLSMASDNECLCPKCKKARVLFFGKVAKCSDVDCGFTIFRERSGKQLTDKQIVTLVRKGKTEVIKGFQSKGGKSFDAALKLDENSQVAFQFPENKKKRK